MYKCKPSLYVYTSELGVRRYYEFKVVLRRWVLVPYLLWLMYKCITNGFWKLCMAWFYTEKLKKDFPLQYFMLRGDAPLHGALVCIQIMVYCINIKLFGMLLLPQNRDLNICNTFDMWSDSFRQLETYDFCTQVLDSTGHHQKMWICLLGDWWRQRKMVQETCSVSSWWNSSVESEMVIGFGMKTSITSKSFQNGLFFIKLEK